MIEDPLIGRQLANFQIESPLGRGGMAQVYYGQDVKLQRPVAIKVIDARYRDNPAYAQRFVREAQAIASWRHEHIIQIYYADDEAGLYYFVMEYIDGQDLGKLISHYTAQDEQVPQAEVLRLGQAVAQALDYAHQHGVIHRDVKPSNVMVANDGRVVLTDFGLAMDAEQGSLGEVFGSAYYAAPEQVKNSAKAVPQSDLYSLGIMLYEMLTGRVPFDDPSSTAVAVQHLTIPPPPPREINSNLNEATEAVLLKALSKSPEERYQTGAELLQALAAALQPGQSATGAGIVAPASLESDQTGKRSLIFAGVGLALVLVIGLILIALLAALFFWPGGADTAAEPAATQATRAKSASAAPEVIATPTGSRHKSTSTPLPATATVTPQKAAQAAVVEASETPPPTPTKSPTPAGPTSYTLVIAKHGEDSLFVVNQTEVSFPITRLSLGKGKENIDGEAWRVKSLASGTCVTAWKEEGEGNGKGRGNGNNKKAPQAPEGVTCSPVGERLTRKGKERFWKETFEVYFDQAQVGTCPKNQDICPITIPIK